MAADADLEAGILWKILTDPDTYIDIEGGAVLIDTSWIGITDEEKAAIKAIRQQVR